MKIAVLDDKGVVAEVRTYPGKIDVSNYVTKAMRESGKYIDLKEHQQDVAQGWVHDKKKGTFSSPIMSSSDLRQDLSQLRKDRQSRGIRYDNRRVECSPESIAGIKSLLDGMNEGRLPPTINFKTKGGYISINKDAVAELFTQCQQHFQNCFDVEAELTQLVNTGEITTPAQVVAEFEKRIPAITF